MQVSWCYHLVCMSSIDGFRPRRSLVFASWSAGEYGSVGATEWLEVRTAYLLKGNACCIECFNMSHLFCWFVCFLFKGYMASIDKKVFTYISLDGVVMGM